MLVGEKMTEEEIKDEMMSSEESEFTMYNQIDSIPKQEQVKYKQFIKSIFSDKWDWLDTCYFLVMEK